MGFSNCIGVPPLVFLIHALKWCVDDPFHCLIIFTFNQDAALTLPPPHPSLSNDPFLALWDCISLKLSLQVAVHTILNQHAE